MADLTIADVHKTFGDVKVLKGVDIHAKSGSFVSLLGSSGCGKSTLLRCIAGLETVDSGTISVGGEDVTDLAPENRRLSMMFQSYALLPHMSVLENVRFPLRMRGKAHGTRAEQRDLAVRALEQVQMDHLASRMPRQLSGGQQQRVALARAIVGGPRLILLDEPLSNLDARLREDMQVELVSLQRSLGVTTVFVTHDQDEALSMSDQVILMQGGVVEQSGTPEDLYANPGTRFAADFLGAANLLDVTGGADRRASVGDVTVPAPETFGGESLLMVRQEDIRVNAPDGCDAHLTAVVKSRVFRGSELLIVVEAAGQELRAVAPTSTIAYPGSEVTVSWRSEQSRILTK
ncbi:MULTISPECIES: ABC transporter ATP-binding protein [unclassified Rhodococcus (in: high G+C Gram-positive bacteria)]|uniref:ABC transporter ATP-binding protein n=1 Tax=unclassified Rhodococcus (in: high G+C Gram-positive bacteria) TaxID=192944 RepID=UPI000E0AB1E3|nr:MULTISPECIES: ABC transporter ATP-binding protein [unclassified Rhodococcus (in: high G+C Gram-positive bacteria)]QKT12459.1 ABC transporter ATP-binding protein [Rhodococcus sp. W8901]RDI22583.1 iron(III) transport system ATP-binding protein/putative spermidine/putrescine transport system ATP-binding protein [Rhodococcus sp. AG1013]